jgi:hypothetical protein
MLRTKYTAFIFCLTLMACDSHIKGTNKEPVFNNFEPESKEYKNELAELIRSNADELTYAFERYTNKNSADYLEITVIGDDIAAKAFVLVKERRNGVEGIIAKKGMAYGGAELYGLQLEVISNPSGAELIYKSVDSIID